MPAVHGVGRLCDRRRPSVAASLPGKLRLLDQCAVRFQADSAFLAMWSSVKCGPSLVAETTRPHRPDGVRHKETNCTRTHRNGATHTGEAVEKTGTNRSRTKRTGIPPPISGPRYRGSNPCLPANKALIIKNLQTHNLKRWHRSAAHVTPGNHRSKKPPQIQRFATKRGEASQLERSA